MHICVTQPQWVKMLVCWDFNEITDFCRLWLHREETSIVSLNLSTIVLDETVTLENSTIVHSQTRNFFPKFRGLKNPPKHFTCIIKILISQPDAEYSMSTRGLAWRGLNITYSWKSCRSLSPLQATLRRPGVCNNKSFVLTLLALKPEYSETCL